MTDDTERTIGMHIQTLCSRFWNTAKGGFCRAGTYIKSILLAKDKRGYHKLTGSVRFCVFLSFFLTFIIECLSRHSFLKGAAFSLISFYVFAFNALILFITFLPAFFLKRKVFYETTVSAFWLAMGITNCIVTCFRVTPFSMIDLLNLPSVLPIIRIYLGILQIVLIVLAILAALAGLVILWIKAPKGGRDLKKGIITSLVALLLLPASLAFGFATGMLSDEFTSLTQAYDRYGFPYCFAVSVVDRGISKPSGYSDSRMDEIIAAIGKCPDNPPEKCPNVVFVQLESFFDVRNLSNVRFSENPIPNFTALSEEGISGYVEVPVIGAGTVNTEFEVLTGMSLDYFGTGEYPYKTALMTDTCESVAYNLMELGYSTHAIHNYQGAFYQRNKVYKNLGFETFTSLEYMQNVEYNISGVWPKDSVLTEEIIKALDSTDCPDFVMAVSVQGHGKYPPNDLPEDYEPKITAEFIDGTIEGGLSDINALVYYVNQLNEMDRFVKELVEAVRNYPEETVLVFYGDHLPSLSFSENDLKNGSVYQTPYVILSNFGLEDNRDTLGTLESYQLAAKVLGLIDIHNGNLTKLHQYFSDAEYYQLWLEDLEYDMLGNYSPHYLYDGNAGYYPQMTDMQMGTNPITVERYEISDGRLMVYGENFTVWSRIVVDGKIQETEYVSENLLILDRVPSGLLTLSVAQIADGGGGILSQCEEVVYSGPDTGTEPS
ncbi:MAG: LTA synthase family protein [Eubacteriales bacterium]